jgi:hypothetical protein
MLHHIDALLISFFRVFPVPIAGYLFGTFCLAMICLVIGQITQAVIWRWNRPWLNTDNREMVRMHNLSLKALSAKDKAAYKASNKVANDAFGKFFFSRMAMGMASLWPVPFALAWMDQRFGDVDFHMTGIGEVGYLATFIPVFILAAILFSKVKNHIPFFAAVARQMQADAEAMGRPMRLSDLMKKPATENSAAAGTPGEKSGE